MKKPPLFTCYALLLILVITAASCQKNGNDPVCHITTILRGQLPDTTSILYNPDGTIARTENPRSGRFKVFTYSPGKIVVTFDNSGVQWPRTEVLLNAQGRITRTTDIRTGEIIASVLDMGYNNAGTLSWMHASLSGDDTVFYQYSNGDIVKSTEGRAVVNYSYYTDKPLRDGDYTKTWQMLNYGAVFMMNRHLVKSIMTANGTINFAYEFDAQGKITRMTQSKAGSADFVTTDYKYTCY